MPESEAWRESEREREREKCVCVRACAHRQLVTQEINQWTLHASSSNVAQSTETIRTIRAGSPRRPPRLLRSS